MPQTHELLAAHQAVRQELPRADGRGRHGATKATQSCQDGVRDDAGDADGDRERIEIAPSSLNFLLRLRMILTAGQNGGHSAESRAC